MSPYLRTDNQIDVLISLREVNHQLQRVKHDDSCWKWATIALASAVNGALTCNLTGTMQVGALEKSLVDKTISALQSESTKNMPLQRLATPSELLNRSKLRERIEHSGSPIIASTSQEDSFNLLFTRRDEFLHFKPSSQSIEVGSLPLTFRNVLDIIKQTIDDGWSFRNLERNSPSALNHIYEEIMQELDQLDNETGT